MRRLSPGGWLFAFAVIVTAAVYWPGLSGGFLFDDYPNIVDNPGVQPHDTSLSSLVRAALSSPSSDFKRPAASLSFAVNFLLSGLDPYWMKVTNLLIHLLNGFLVFILARSILIASRGADDPLPSVNVRSHGAELQTRESLTAALIATGWMLLPINLTGVLYVVQRMESMANVFVLLGLIGYVAGRRRMLGSTRDVKNGLSSPNSRIEESRSSSFWLCVTSIAVPTVAGILCKETAVMLPLYALFVEWALFGFNKRRDSKDRGIMALFLIMLALPMIAGLGWLLPGLLDSQTWATRDFTLGTRVLSEARIVLDYAKWTLLPSPSNLSFYHDNFQVSTGLLTPWTTLASVVSLVALVTLALWLRRHRPLAALGIALFLSCQLLTGTILPLELIYEHRNYFASFGLMLAVVPLLTAFSDRSTSAPFVIARRVLLGGLLVLWGSETAMSAAAWGHPLQLAETLAARAPDSPRALYELGRTYVIHSRYDPTSAFTKLAYAPLERAATLPGSSIMPEQALIFMTARMHLPIKDAWWTSLIAKLKARQPGVQDESSLGALTQCVREHHCDLPTNRMVAAFEAALSHPDPSARLLATYSDYAWNVLDNKTLGQALAEKAVRTEPNEAAYQITLIRMLAAQKKVGEARQRLQQLKELDFGGRLDSEIVSLKKILDEL